ncbi:MAG: hypothetical protein AAGI63_02570, partial [Planctomycetota bacterium]
MNDPGLDTAIQSPQPKRARSRRIAIVVSVLTHALIAIVLLFIYLPNPATEDVAQTPASSTTSSAEETSG